MPSDSSSSSSTSSYSINLPLPIGPGFECGQLAEIFGTCQIDGAFLADRGTGRLVAVNQRLAQILRHDVDDLGRLEEGLPGLIREEDRDRWLRWLTDPDRGEDESFETALLSPSGLPVSVEIRVRQIRWERVGYVLGLVRPSGERLRREARLEQQVTLQKQRAVQALKSSLSVYELNERIRSTLVLTTALLKADSEQRLYEEVQRVLTNSEGLNFRDVTIYLTTGDRLEPTCSTRTPPPPVLSLEDDHDYSRCLREATAVVSDDTASEDRQMIVPLQTRDAVIGVLDVRQYQHEKVFFEEFRLLRAWQRDMVVQIADTIALMLDNLRLTREIKRQSITDALTGAYNRHFLVERLQSEVQRTTRYGSCVSLVFIDVDRFKEINDGWGHLQGDRVLQDLGGLFRSVLRETDLLCRYGGDEFLVLLPETGEDQARRTAEKILGAVREHPFLAAEPAREPVPVTVSVGTSTLRPGQSAQEFLQSADAALYRAKESGRDRLCADF